MTRFQVLVRKRIPPILTEKDTFRRPVVGMGTAQDLFYVDEGFTEAYHGLMFGFIGGHLIFFTLGPFPNP